MVKLRVLNKRTYSKLFAYSKILRIKEVEAEARKGGELEKDGGNKIITFIQIGIL